MSDHDLKLALAKMLPEKIYPDQAHHYNSATGVHDPTGVYMFRWKHMTPSWRSGDEIDETEWLHVCWLVEQKLTTEQRVQFCVELDKNQTYYDLPSKSWQQRAEALIRATGEWK